MWKLLADLLTQDTVPAALRADALRLAEARAAFIGGELDSFITQVSRASPDVRVRVLLAQVKRRIGPSRRIVRELMRIAEAREVATRARRRALSALSGVSERPDVLALVTRLASDKNVADAARRVAHLSDRGEQLNVKKIEELGLVDFGTTEVEAWDPVQLGTIRRLRLPASRATIFAMHHRDRATVKLVFHRGEVRRWTVRASFSSSFGTIALSKAGVRRELDAMEAAGEFTSGFWDEVFDAAWSEPASIIDLSLEGRQVPVLGWLDMQRGVTLYEGVSQSGRPLTWLLDCARVRSEDDFV